MGETYLYTFKEHNVQYFYFILYSIIYHLVRNNSCNNRYVGKTDGNVATGLSEHSDPLKI